MLAGLNNDIEEAAAAAAIEAVTALRGGVAVRPLSLSLIVDVCSTADDCRPAEGDRTDVAEDKGGVLIMLLLVLSSLLIALYEPPWPCPPAPVCACLPCVLPFDTAAAAVKER